MLNLNIVVSDQEKKKEVYYEWELLNKQKPIWLRPKEDVKDEDYQSFYKAITTETNPPLGFTHFVAEGEIDFKSILYIPEAP